MVWIVVAIHLILSLGLLWATWQVWHLRLTLANVAKSVDGYAEKCQRGLSVAPPAILLGQKGAGKLKQKYRDLLPQLQRLQMFLGLFGGLFGLSKSLSRSLGKSRQSSKSQSQGSKKRSDRNVKRRR